MEFVDLRSQHLRLADEIKAALNRVMEHGRFIMGPEVHELERALEGFSGARHAITCSSGTDALIMALMAWDIGPGDVVIVPSFTFAASAEAVALLGATPFFVDVEPSTFLIDVEKLSETLDKWKGDVKPAAVMAVDLFGQPADYPALSEMARHHGCHLLADAAQSFGARVGERQVGTLADVTTTSFFPAKPLGAYGDGGAVFTDDDGLAEVLRSLRVHGKGTDKYHNARVGLNARLDTMQAAILLVKLRVFREELELRQEVADRYSALLQRLVEVPRVEEGRSSAWAQYTVQSSSRDAIAAALSSEGVPSAVYYPVPLHAMDCYAGHPRSNDLDTTTMLSSRVLSLPMHPYLKATEQDRVASLIASVVQDAITSRD